MAKRRTRRPGNPSDNPPPMRRPKPPPPDPKSEAEFTAAIAWAQQHNPSGVKDLEAGLRTLRRRNDAINPG